jgi:DegV family protein with EDD domain
MAQVRIVTDSSAELSADTVARLAITVIPLSIHFGQESFRDGIDLSPREFFRRLAGTNSLPYATAPPLHVFEDTFKTLGKETEDIVSIHISAKLSGTANLARQAASSLIGQHRIAAVDSLSTSLGQKELVIAAGEAAQQGANIDEVVRLVRGMTPHIYLVFFVESLEYLERGGRIGKAEALLGTMLGIKPLLIIEDGEILPLEKVRTRSNGIDKLFEFITEFPHIEKVTILKGVNAIDPAGLLDRLHASYPDRDIRTVTYGPILCTFLGPGAVGVFVYEGMSQA